MLVVMLIAFPSSLFLLLSLYYFTTGQIGILSDRSMENWSLKYNWIKLFGIFSPRHAARLILYLPVLLFLFLLSVSHGVSWSGKVTESINPARENSGGPKRWS